MDSGRDCLEGEIKKGLNPKSKISRSVRDLRSKKDIGDDVENLLLSKLAAFK